MISFNLVSLSIDCFLFSYSSTYFLFSSRPHTLHLMIVLFSQKFFKYIPQFLFISHPTPLHFFQIKKILMQVTKPVELLYSVLSRARHKVFTIRPIIAPNAEHTPSILSVNAGNDDNYYSLKVVSSILIYNNVNNLNLQSRSNNIHIKMFN